MRLILTILIFIFPLAHAEEWQHFWISGMESLESKDWEQAEFAFDRAVEIIEQTGNVECPHVYVDRARLRCCMEKYQQAFEDISVAMNSPYLGALDRSVAILMRQQVHVNNGRMDKAIEDMNAFRDSYPYVPKIEFVKNKVYIRNMPNCKCSLAMIKSYLTSSGLCESENDMKVLPSGLFLATLKSADCGCGCGGKCDDGASVRQECAPSCQDVCDSFAASGQAWCGKGFAHNFACLIACAGTVESLRQKCHHCCASGNFYQHCIKPFEHILEAMGTGCDPLWD